MKPKGNCSVNNYHWVKVKETQLNVKKKQNILLPLDKSGEAIK
jgi:hypothetical protein